MTTFQIIFDFLVLVFLVILMFIFLTNRKKLKDFKNSYISLKELYDNFEDLIDRCEVEGGKMLENMEDERLKIESSLDNLKSNDIVNKKLEWEKNQKTDEMQEVVNKIERPYSPELQDHLQNKYFEIYKLADSGKTPKQIEKDLSIPLGEIELILSLRK